MKKDGTSRPQIRAGGRLRLAGLAAAFLLAGPVRLWSQGEGHGLDPQKTITQYTLEIWQTEEGLPQTTVYAMTQTPDGYLWVGTQAGLSRFDGITFRTWSPANTPGLRHRYVRALLPDREGNLWIGTGHGGISRMKDGQVVAFEDEYAGAPINALYQDRLGIIWAGSDSGLLRLQGGRFRAVAGVNAPVHAFAERQDGTLLIGSDRGISAWRNGALATWQPRQGGIHGPVLSLLQDRSGDLWIGTSRDLIRASSTALQHFTSRDGVSASGVSRIYQTQNGQIWFGTRGAGVGRFHQGRFEAFSEENGLEGNEVSTILEDREGGLWFATEDGGLNRFRDPIFTTYGRLEGLPTDMVWSVYGEPDGTMWVGTDRGGLIRIRSGATTIFSPANGFPSASAYSTIRTADGSLWVGGDNGVLRYRQGRWEDLSRQEGAPTGWISALHEDGSGALWIGTQSGIYQWKNGRFRSFSREAGIAKARVWTICEDQDGALWFGTDGEGLIQLQNGRFRTYTTEDGLTSNVIHSLYADEHGLWIGVEFGGLGLLRNGKVTPLPFTDRMALSDLYHIDEDAMGNLWMSSSQGLYSVPEHQLLEAADGGRSAVDIRRFDVLDGLRHTEFNGAGRNAGWRGEDGRLWFPTVRGLVVVDPNRLSTNTLPPPVHLGQIKINGAELDPVDGLELPAGASDLEITYTATSLTIPSRVSFRYKLEGYDRDWVDAGNRRVAYYTGLNAGDYRFLVMAANNDGVWNSAGAAVDFRIKPQFQETIWFWALVALAAGAALTLLLRIRVRSLARQAGELATLVDERTAELKTSEERYRELFDANPQPVWVYDRETLAFLAVNEAAVRHYGHTREEFLGMTLSDIKAPPEPGEPATGTSMSTQGYPIPTVRLHRTKDGKAIEVEEAVHEIDFGGRKAQLVVALDVTARRDLEDRLRQAQKMEAIGQLTGGIAHDLNNVLTAVIAHVDLAVATLTPEPDLLADLTQAQSAAHRGAGIIRKLLGFSRRERLVLRPLALSDFVGEFTGTLRRLIPTHIEISVSLDPALPPIAADVGTVQQMLLNLATNARDSMPEGGRLHVEVGRKALGPDHFTTHGWGTPGSYVFLSVTDTGTGMDAATRDKIFEPFFTTKAPGLGSGLGMAMVYGLIKQHQGYVMVESEMGKGTVATLYFPVSGAPIPAPSPEAPRAIPTGHETILLVEDEPAVRAAATRALTRFGYRVVVAPDGEEGLRHWRENPGGIDLIVSDAIMPRMGGLALYDTVSRERPDVRFLLTSGYTGEEVSRSGNWRSDLPFLPKPWTVTELLAGVREVLNRPQSP